MVGRLQSDCEAWRTRDLSTDDIAYLFRDGWYPVVRIGKQRARVAILVTLAGRTTGERVVRDLRLVGQETAAGWTAAIAALVGRGLRPPGAGRDRWERGPGAGANRGLAADRAPALRGAQAAQPGGESPGEAP